MKITWNKGKKNITLGKTLLHFTHQIKEKKKLILFKELLLNYLFIMLTLKTI